MARNYGGKRRQNPDKKVMGTRGFQGGLQQISHPSSLKDNELAEARNIEYFANGVIKKRLGSQKLGSATGTKINSLFGCYSVGGNDYFIRISDTGIAQYYNWTNEVWTNISGSPTFSDVYTNIIQAYGYVHFLNAVDDWVKWDGTSWTTFNTLVDPTSAPSASKTGSADDNVTYYYKYVWYNETGNTTPSPSVSVTDCPDVFPEDGSTYITVTLPTAPAGTSYVAIFRGIIEGYEEYLDKVPAAQTTYIDRGIVEPDDSYLVPTENTTKGVHFKYADVYHQTLIGTTAEHGDHALVFTGGGDKFESTGRVDGGGYYYWRKDDGSPVTGVKAFTLSNEDGLYVTKRDKIGIFRFDESGGAVQDINVSFGAISHLSIHAAYNDLRLWGENGAGSVRNEPNFATIIRTKILSINADVTAKSITHEDADGIAGIYYDYRSFFAIPTGNPGTGNNTVLVYDERFNAWAEWRGITAAIWATFIRNGQRKLFFGSSSSGDVVEMFQGTTDDGNPVVMRISTKQFDDDKPYAYKKFRRIIYVFGNISGSDTEIRLLEDGVRSQLPMAVTGNQGDTGMGADLMGDVLMGDSSGSYEPDTSGLIVRYADLNNKDLTSIQTTIENDGLTDAVEIVGVYIIYSDSNKPLKSSMKLQRSAVL